MKLALCSPPDDNDSVNATDAFTLLVTFVLSKFTSQNNSHRSMNTKSIATENLVNKQVHRQDQYDSH